MNRHQPPAFDRLGELVREMDRRDLRDSHYYDIGAQLFDEYLYEGEAVVPEVEALYWELSEYKEFPFRVCINNTIQDISVVEEKLSDAIRVLLETNPHLDYFILKKARVIQ